MEQNDKPKVGIGVMILKSGKVLLGKRKGSHGEGEYSFPGGHIEYLESFHDCVTRELKEECGVKVSNLRFQFISNVTKYAPKHYVHIGMLAEWEEGDPIVMEPDKVESWEWYNLEAIPQPMFEMCAQAIDCYRNGKNYYDIPVRNNAE